jgi:hypothetical protein
MYIVLLSFFQTDLPLKQDVGCGEQTSQYFVILSVYPVRECFR